MPIPKIIHYCWVGGKPKPQSVLYCIESWKRCCPDYEIREWNESNYDFTKNEYMRQAYEAKKWGFVPDYARLDIVYEYGGIYLDTDVEMLRSFDELLEHSSFFGFEDTGEGKYYIACGLGFGSEPYNPLLKELRDYYDNISFFREDGSLDLLPAPRHNTPIFEDHGVLMNNSLQKIRGNVFFPSEYFCPKIFKTGKTHVTHKTFSIHHFSASWMDEKIRKEISHNQAVCLRWGNVLGRKLLWLESVWSKYGFLGSLKRLLIRAYECFYCYFPLILGTSKRLFFKSVSSEGIALFDTAMRTANMGDYIIMESCEEHLREVLDLSDVIRLSTHIIPDDSELNSIARKRKILCGTNILSCNMKNYGLWKLPRKLTAYCNTTLMGAGFDSYNTNATIYSKLLLNLILSRNGIHSVRDSFSEKMLRKMGIQNVLNTGCPTMWDLTPEHCAAIPTQKAKNVVCTLTDYCRDEENDRAMLDILLGSYQTVYFWLQGRDDLEYIRSLGYENKVTLVQPTLKSLDAVLEQADLDYIGTRLHAGIRALNKGRRSLIISIDNRAECIHADTGLPIIHRKDIPEMLRKRIAEETPTKLSMPWENIAQWKNQFRDWQD